MMGHAHPRPRLPRRRCAHGRGPTTPALLRAVAGSGSLAFLPAGYRSAVQLASDLTTTSDVAEAVGVNLFVPDPRPVDAAAVRRYRDLIAPEVEALGCEVGPVVLDDDDDWAAKVDHLSATRCRG